MAALRAALCTLLLLAPASPLVPLARPRRTVRLQALAEDLLAAEGPALASLVEDNFEAIDAETMASIQQATPDVAERIMSAFAVETDRRMNKAKERLEHVLDAGELLEMDRRLTTLFKQGQADAALLLCLNANVEAADPNTDKHSIMLHLYTRAQEEFEKKADPARALVHKLCRQPDPQIRDNILRTYLAPQTELIAPDATRIPLEKPMPAQISHAQFSESVASTVEQLRGLDADGDLVNANIECCRQVAIEARRVLLETGPPDDVRAFEEELAKTWPMGSPEGNSG